MASPVWSTLYVQAFTLITDGWYLIPCGGGARDLGTDDRHAALLFSQVTFEGQHIYHGRGLIIVIRVYFFGVLGGGQYLELLTVKVLRVRTGGRYESSSLST